MDVLRPGRPVRTWLAWAAWFYGLAARAREWWYRTGWGTAVRLPCRVVSVGNITVGGTGKTPVVILLTEWLLAQGHRVAVLSRGYQRTGRAPQVLVSDGQRLLAGPAEAGDEPALIARRCPRAVVAVGADRAALGRWVLDRHPVDCIVLDDGFQHRSLHRDVDLVLLDATDAAGLDALLPAGRLREPLAGLARATALVITRADSAGAVDAVRRRLEQMGGLAGDCMEVVFRPDRVLSIARGSSESSAWCRGKRAWLVSAIGNNESFSRSARDLGVTVLGATVFRDHHRYTAGDVRSVRAEAERVGAEIVLTTEKDAVKLAERLAAADPWWALRLQAEVVRGHERLRRLVVRPVPPESAEPRA